MCMAIALGVQTPYALYRSVRRVLLLLLMLSLFAGMPAAQDEQEAKRAAAVELLTEGLRLFNKGTRESLQAALPKYIAALAHLEAVGDMSAGARVRDGIGQIYDSLGDPREALRYYGQALSDRRTIGDRRGVVISLNNIGNVYKGLGEKSETLSHYTKALTLAREIGDRGGEATALNNTGRAYHDWGEARKALDYYTQALSHFQFLEDSRNTATTLNNIATVYNDWGEAQQAFDYYEKALNLARKARDLRQQAVTLNNIGTVYASFGDRQNALKYFKQALPLRRDAGDMAGQAQTLNNIGTILNALDEPEDSLVHFNQALDLRRAAGDRVGEAQVMSNIGTVYYDWGKYDEALTYYSKALALRRVIQDPQGTATTLNNVGTAFGRLGEVGEAVKYLQLALKLTRFLGDRHSEAGILFNVAYLESGRGDLTAALSNSESALGLLESLRTRTASHELRASYFATEHSKYQFYIDLLMRLHKQHPSAGYGAKGLQASERERARGLVELLAEAQVDIRLDVDPALTERERTLRERLNAKAQEQQQLVPGQHDAKQSAALAKEVNDTLSELHQVEARIRQASPRYAALSQPRPLTLTEMQTQVLDADTLLLEYSLGVERSYLWAVTPTSINSYVLPSQLQLETAAKQFYHFLAAPEVAGQADARQQELTETASYLSRVLLGPVTSQLGGKRLLIVADGALQYVPFAALPDPAAGGQDLKGQQPLLIARHEIINLPSLSVLPTLRDELTKRRPAQQTIAILADPVFSADDGRVKKDLARKNSKDLQSRLNGTSVLGGKQEQTRQGALVGPVRLPRLPGTRKEATGIFALASPDKAKLALDFDANRELVLSGELGQYRYVHFATHGWMDERHSALSSIVLSLVDGKGDSQNGYLRLNEIYNLNLPVDLVTLSGCETGLGQELAGEGLVGLTRGFMYAGAARVLVSLWRVNDEAAAELMVHFYRGVLNGGKTPAAALRAAQIEILRQGRWRAPHYWAAFVLQGEWR